MLFVHICQFVRKECAIFVLTFIYPVLDKHISFKKNNRRFCVSLLGEYLVLEGLAYLHRNSLRGVF